MTRTSRTSVANIKFDTIVETQTQLGHAAQL